MQPFGHNRHWRKIRGATPPFWGGGSGSPCNTMWPGPRPTCMPSFILIHPTVWPQYNTPTSQTGQDRQTDRQRTESIRGLFYKWSPKPKENELVLKSIKTAFIRVGSTFSTMSINREHSVKCAQALVKELLIFGIGFLLAFLQRAAMLALQALY